MYLILCNSDKRLRCRRGWTGSSPARRIAAKPAPPSSETLAMLKDRTLAQGAVHRLFLDSTALAGNLLGDPTRRAVDVYVPAGHDGAGLPLLVDVVGYTGSGL